MPYLAGATIMEDIAEQTVIPRIQEIPLLLFALSEGRKIGRI